MSRISLVLICAAALAAIAAQAACSPIVRADGQVGRFRIDVSTEKQIRAEAGKPSKVEDDFNPLKKAPVGHTLIYSCGRDCDVSYSINNTTRRLSDFSTTSPHFVTERGSRVGMRGAEAARRERTKLVPGCGDGLYIHVRWDAHHIFVLTVWRGRVDSILYEGPHTIYYEGLC